MRYYVMSDIHGFYTLFRRTLAEAGWDEDSGDKRLVLLGDIFDRGEEALAMQEGILELLRGGETILIRGNHEDLFVALLNEDRGRPLRHHLHNGTYQTALQLTGLEPGCMRFSARALVLAARQTPYYTDILPAAVNYLETPRYIFTHGWLPSEQSPFGWVWREDWRSADTRAWRDARWINGMAAARVAHPEDKTVVCGHYHCSYGHCAYEGKGSEFGEDADFSPYCAPGVIAIDACTALSGKMNCLVLED